MSREFQDSFSRPRGGFRDRSDRGDRGGSKRPIPVEEGKEYDVEVINVGEKGDGVAKYKGYVVIVPNTKAGDKVKVKITAVRGKVSFAEVVGKSSGKVEEADEDDSEEAVEESDESEDE